MSRDKKEEMWVKVTFKKSEKWLYDDIVSKHNSDKSAYVKGLLMGVLQNPNESNAAAATITNDFSGIL